MTHQIPPHLIFCTPGQNQEEEQGTILKTSKRERPQKETETKRHTWKQTDLHNPQWILGKERSRQHPTHKESEKPDTYENHPSNSKHWKIINQLKRWIKSNRTSQDALYHCISQVSRLLYTLKALMKNKQQIDLASL